MLKIKKIVTLALAILLVVAVSGTVSAQQMKWRFAHSMTMEDTNHLASLEIAKMVEQRSKGALKLEVFPAGQLGHDSQIIDAVKLGAIDMIVTGNTFFTSLAPEINVMDLPYLFRDYAHVYKVLDGPVGAEVMKSLERSNIKILGNLENGFRNVTNNKRPIMKPEDMKGLKLRTTPNPAALKAFRSLGANPVAMPFTEVYLALKTGTVDGQENPVTMIHAQKFYEVQKYMSLTAHSYTVHYVAMNFDKYQALTPELKQILHESIKEAVVWQRKLNRSQEGKMMDTMRAAGMKIEEHPDNEAFSKACADASAEEYVKRFGRNMLDQIKNTR